jgi:hypothetical protein
MTEGCHQRFISVISGHKMGLSDSDIRRPKCYEKVDTSRFFLHWMELFIVKTSLFLDQSVSPGTLCQISWVMANWEQYENARVKSLENWQIIDLNAGLQARIVAHHKRIIPTGEKFDNEIANPKCFRVTWAVIPLKFSLKFAGRKLSPMPRLCQIWWSKGWRLIVLCQYYWRASWSSEISYIKMSHSFCKIVYISFYYFIWLAEIPPRWWKTAFSAWFEE